MRYKKEHISTDHDVNRGDHTQIYLDFDRVYAETTLTAGSPIEVLITEGRKYITVDIVLDFKSNKHLSECRNPKFLKARTGTYYPEFDIGRESDEEEYHSTNIILRFEK